MALEDTAGAAVDNGLEIEGTTDEAPESELDTTPEADTEGTTETPSFDDLDDDTLKAHPRIANLLKGMEASARESARQKSEVDTARRLQQQQQDFVVRGGVRQATEKAIEKARDTGNISDALEEIQKISNAVYAANTAANLQTFDTALSELIPEGATIPAKKAEEIERIKDGVATGRKTAEDLIKARLDLLADLNVEARLPALRKQWLAEEKKKAAALTKVTNESGADAARDGQAQPTSVSGKGSGAITAKSLETASQQQMADWLSDPVTEKQVHAAMAVAAR